MNRLTSLIIISVFCVFAVFWLNKGETQAVPEDVPFEMIRRHLPPLKPQFPDPGNRKVTAVRIEKGDTLGSLLQKYGVSDSDSHAIASAMDDVFSSRKIKIGALLTFYFDEKDGLVNELKISNAVDQAVRISRQDNDIWKAQELDLHLFTSVVRGAGSISDSLWNAARNQSIPPDIILDMADLFGWQVDFTSGLKKDDSFDVFYTTRTLKDLGSVSGIITAARFTNANNDFFAFSYVLPDGQTQYYDSDGNSMKRAFLKTPLQYRYISSGFSRSRFHPILKIHRPHLGIDYAAPKGTPVSALGEGVVVYCGWKGGYGNYVQIKHGDSYETCYGHLQSFGKGVRKGSHVNQGQVIGYVGSTGLSTGPHLDFRVKYRGKFINPADLKSEPAAPIPDELRDDYHKYRSVWLERFGLNKEGGIYVTG